MPSAAVNAISLNADSCWDSETSFETVSRRSTISRRSIDATNDNVVYSDIHQATKNMLDEEEEEEAEEEKKDLGKSSRNGTVCLER